MNKVFLEYCFDGFNVVSEGISSFEELKNQLQNIKKDVSEIINCSFSVDIIVENIGTLSIGLDEKYTLLSYCSVDDEALTSLGDEFAEGETIFYFGDYSLISNKYLIPYDVALEALQIWIENGVLSKDIRWTDKLF